MKKKKVYTKNAIKKDDRFYYKQLAYEYELNNYNNNNNNWNNSNKSNNICNGQAVALNNDMIISMTNSWSTTNESYLSTNKLVIVDDARVTIKTSGCKKMKGTITYNDNETTEKPNVTTAFYREDVGVCGYICPNLINKFVLTYGKSQDFEIDINNTNQIVIQKSALPYYRVITNIENIYFE